MTPAHIDKEITASNIINIHSLYKIICRKAINEDILRFEGFEES